ncbi:hypothetical protein P154DRAFT_238975 [Amniculicola lignicola CBS 123094]|uniref:Uncharacterized protein n=1 Tax=Amniculicola lignicola CBS 123094 TaxID=1392246 RepID=A0A6A5WDZ8_9PLEO|nr:hypothetical protein P154DRAFT_238975 [Amniculicola lignicola CBS 123094]
MLARGSSDAGTRLRRSKSTSTVHTVHRQPHAAPEPLDPHVAQQHAIAAATTAYVNAHGNAAVERATHRSSELPRTKSNASRKSQGSHFPPRESSVRSIHPQKGGQVSSISRQIRAPAMVLEKFPPFQATPAVERGSTSQLSITFNENIRPSSQPKPHRSSAASSVASQQIRKARSMYYASSVQTGSPMPRPAKYLISPPTVSVSPVPDPALMLVRTTAVSSLASPRIPVTVKLNETVDEARDKYLQDFQHRQVRQKPSLFLAPFKKRQDKGKGKARSASSGGILQSNVHTPGETGLDLTFSDFKPQKEKRSFSNSLKNKFKKVFRRTSNNPPLPVQHIEARQDYFGDRAATEETISRMQRSFEIPSPDDETLHRVRSRTPTLEGGRPSMVRPISRGSNHSNRSLHSNQSFRSEADFSNAATSRVTSWSNSSAGGTLTQRDIKRLTVIHEAKDSIGSEAERKAWPPSPSRKPPPIPSLAAFHAPMTTESAKEESPAAIDPKRVFSALMKEIDASKAAQSPLVSIERMVEDDDLFAPRPSRELHSSGSRQLRSVACKEFRTGNSIDTQRPNSYRRPESVGMQSRTSSIRSFTRAIKATIRTVPLERSSSPVPDRATSVRGLVRIPRPNTAGSSSGTGSDSQRRDDDNNTSTVHFKVRARVPPQQTPYAETVVTPTPEQIEKRVQRSKGRWKTPLEDNSLPFFPRTTNRTYAVTNFAQKTSTPRRMGEEADTDMKTPEAEPQNQLSVPTSPRSGRSPRPRPIFSPLSPSVYSRNTDGVSILPNDSVMSFDGASDEAEVGTAVIMTSRPVKSYMIGSPSPPRDTHSNRSSRDWKTWLSHEVSELENMPQEDLSIHENYSTPIGHHREFTQIEDEDATITISEPTEVFTPRQTVEEIQEVQTPTDKLIPEAVDDASKESSVSIPASKRSQASQSSQDSREGRRVSRSMQSNSKPRIERFSSRASEASSLGRWKADTPSSERMNDRFPYIKSNRRSSNNSARYSGTSRSTPDSGSSSLKATAQKIYSDFSAPSSNRTSKHEANMRSKRSDVIIESDKENQKENNTPPTAVKPLSVLSLQPENGRPKSLQIFPTAALNHNPSSLAQYTTSASEAQTKRMSGPVATPPLLRLLPHTNTTNEASPRPRGAFDLRGISTPTSASLPAKLSGSESPLKRAPRRDIQRKPVTGRALEGDTLRMLLESPWAVSGPPSPRSSPPRASPDLRHLPLHIKHSSSTLALNKEPSPGTEIRCIDAMLEDRAREEWRRIHLESPLSMASGEGRDGRTTPGQRLAERFLRERSMGSGAGTPESPVGDAETVVGNDEQENRDVARERVDTPAFL